MWKLLYRKDKALIDVEDIRLALLANRLPIDPRSLLEIELVKILRIVARAEVLYFRFAILPDSDLRNVFFLLLRVKDAEKFARLAFGLLTIYLLDCY